MSVAVVLGPSFAALADEVSSEGDAGVRVRRNDESPAERRTALRALMDETDSVLIVERALPVRPDWATSGALFALVADHINLTGDNPLVGPNADEWGPRFPDLTDAWDPALRRALRESALAAGVELREGVVAGVAGESRTAAELGMLRMVGADMASRGFVHEAIVARHADRRVAGLAVLSAGTELPDETAAVSRMVRAAVRTLDGAGATPDPNGAGADV